MEPGARRAAARDRSRSREPLDPRELLRWEVRLLLFFLVPDIFFAFFGAKIEWKKHEK